MLAHLGCADTSARLATGFGVGIATVHRDVTELVLAGHAWDLAASVQIARRKAYTVLDGTLIALDRVGMRTKTDRPYYSGEPKRHGPTSKTSPTAPAG